MKTLELTYSRLNSRFPIGWCAFFGLILLSNYVLSTSARAVLGLVVISAVAAWIVHSWRTGTLRKRGPELILLPVMLLCGYAYCGAEIIGGASSQLIAAITYTSIAAFAVFFVYFGIYSVIVLRRMDRLLKEIKSSGTT
jgi:hypothetical protein